MSNIRSNGVVKVLNELIERYPALKVCEEGISDAYTLLESCYAKGGKLMVAGNGGSAADADHIVGELLKGFCSKRPLGDDMKAQLKAIDSDLGSELAENLQGSFPAIALGSQSGIITAVLNDIGAKYVYAQQLMGYANAGDVVWLISTSGNSANILAAAAVAKLKGAKVIGMTGEHGGKMNGRCDVHIKAPSTYTAGAQEYHLPIYHALCRMLEIQFYRD